MKQGWEIKKLGDICDKTETIDPTKQPDKTFIYLDVSSINKETKQIELPTTLLGADAPSRARKLVKTNDIIFATVRPTHCRVALITPEYDNQVCSTGYFVIRPKEEIISNYIFYFILTCEFMKKMELLQKGANYPAITDSEVKNITISYPKSLSEQERIVSILGKAFSAIDQAKQNAEKNLKNAKELFESYLQGVFEKKGKGWEEKTLGDVANTNGRIGWKGLTAKEYTEGGPLFLSVHSLNYGDYVDFRDAFHITQSRYDESPEIMLQKNDILICKDGAGIGKLGIVPELPDTTTINSSLLLIRCKNQVQPKYLYYNLLSPLFQSIVQSRLNGATTPHLYQRDIVTFPILVPPLKTQQAIVEKLDALRAETKKLEAIYQHKITELEELKKSILQKAFTGELC